MLLLAMNPTPLLNDLPVGLCTIDRCNKIVCTMETPIGMVSVVKKPGYTEGLRVDCPLADPNPEL